MRESDSRPRFFDSASFASRATVAPCVCRLAAAVCAALVVVSCDPSFTPTSAIYGGASVSTTPLAAGSPTASLSAATVTEPLIVERHMVFGSNGTPPDRLEYRNLFDRTVLAKRSDWRAGRDPDVSAEALLKLVGYRLATAEPTGKGVFFDSFSGDRSVLGGITGFAGAAQHRARGRRVVFASIESGETRLIDGSRVAQGVGPAWAKVASSST